MFNLFNRNQQLLDEDIIQWIFETYTWAMRQFDKTVFYQESTLVLPNNEYFPGKETSAEGMASLIFEQVKQYAGMAHWPTFLFNVETGADKFPMSPPLSVRGQLRGKGAIAEFTTEIVMQSAMPQSTLPLGTGPAATNNRLTFTYHPQQLKSPEGIIAHFAQGLSNHLVNASNSPPPGGSDYLPMASELVGIFMGFGVIFANSAVVQRAGGCGRCGGAQSPVRDVVLSKEETSYALAVFCQLKGIDSGKASKHLKKHLRGFFKAAVKDCQKRREDKSCMLLKQQA